MFNLRMYKQISTPNIEQRGPEGGGSGWNPSPEFSSY